jgi:hypothetical protein
VEHASSVGAEKAAVKALLDHFGIKSAVIVDDEAYGVAFSDVAAIVSIHRDAARDALGKLGTGLTFDAPDLWRQPLEDKWNYLVPEAQDALYKRLAALEGDAARTHARFASDIRDLLGVPCAAVQPDEWTLREDEFVKNAVTEKDGARWCTTLLLFDLDLHKAGRGNNGGATLALDVIAKNKGVDILCGIVSSLVGADDEGAALPDVPNGFDYERVVRISKADLPDKPNQFVYGVKRALLAPHVERLRAAASAIIASAHSAATVKVSELEIYDIVHAVITRSDEEGVRDFETLFRIHNVFYTDELRRRAYASGPLATIAAELRGVSLVAPSASKPTDRKTWELQRRGIYDDVIEVNRLHLAVELGDVFACEGRDGALVEYIVLAQPCDLMIRTKTGRRRACHVLVARVSKSEPAKGEGESLGSFNLPYYSEGGKDVWVKFADHYTVPAWILDLCVYNDDGRARFRDDAETLPGLNAAWTRHAALLKSDVEKGLRRLLVTTGAKAAKGAGSDEDQLLIDLPERVLAQPFVLASARLSPLALDVRCRRVQRVLAPYSADMLTKFGHYLSRTAFEVDLGEGTLD